MTTLVLAVVPRLRRRRLAGLFGVGGGIVFVPALLALHLSQLHAEATSLAAILPTAATGIWRQRRYGNLHRGPRS